MFNERDKNTHHSHFLCCLLSHAVTPSSSPFRPSCRTTRWCLCQWPTSRSTSAWRLRWPSPESSWLEFMFSSSSRWMSCDARAPLWMINKFFSTVSAALLEMCNTYSSYLWQIKLVWNSPFLPTPMHCIIVYEIWNNRLFSTLVGITLMCCSHTFLNLSSLDVNLYLS